jgi:hypothetical protein
MLRLGLYIFGLKIQEAKQNNKNSNRKIKKK